MNGKGSNVANGKTLPSGTESSVIKVAQPTPKVETYSEEDIQTGAATSFNYMKSSWFWLQVGGTMVVALAVGAQLI